MAMGREVSQYRVKCITIETSGLVVRMPKVRTVFLSASDIAIPCLERLLEINDCQLVGIVTQPERPRGRGQKYSPNPIATWTQSHRIAYLQTERMDDNVFVELQQMRIDLALVMAFGHILKRRFLDLPALGMWNFHTSLLPKYRGASPIQTCLLMGEHETGVTLMRMVEKLDAGPWIAQKIVGIEAQETAYSLTQKLAHASADLLAEYWGRLVQKNYSVIEQIEPSATVTRKLHKADGLLDFNETALSLERKVRALNPWPGTFFRQGSECIKVHAAHVIDEEIAYKPGTVLFDFCHCPLGIATSMGVLAIDQLQRSGGKILHAKEFLNGNKFLFK
ncbi:MAG: methionyl-tRNA formyltransferase [Puniceicoccales bacterium]|jgi:methionyl-tRNA formyltransferase|nr:methionyl-tRNA formyltransferase [Puniceicoccales bacterium]